ncbi:WD40 repeat domain-containing protein [Aquisphaera insulae]|uniref:WD40 repeat domain-containing protein n=1 Tax=Aquisphaera insulae TaxID=2712864 RepID=UPI0013ECEBFF|nr:WD40 repeat domain-containing protein [Aquisphaera insulae]
MGIWLPTSLAYSPDGSTAAIGLHREAIDATTAGDGPRDRWGIGLIDWCRQAVRTVISDRFHEGARLAFTPDGKTLISSHMGGILLLDPSSERRTEIASDELRTANGEPLPFVEHMVMPTHGDGILIGDDRWLVALDLATHKPNRSFRLGGDSLYALSSDPDGSTLVSAGRDHRVILRDGITGAVRAILCGENHGQDFHRVLDARFAGRQIITAHLDRSVRFWDPDGRRLIRTVVLPIDDHWATISMRIAPDGGSVAVVGSVLEDGIRYEEPGCRVILVIRL